MGNDNQNVDVGDGAIVFHETKNKRQLVLAEGKQPQPGDIIGLHPTDIKTIGDTQVTHGLNKFEVGDEVIIRELKTKDEAAFRPGEEDYFHECQAWPYSFHNHSQMDERTGYRWFYEYQIALARPIKRLPNSVLFPRTNIILKFDISYNADGFQNFWPYGAVWIGVSQDDETYYWCSCTDPRMVLSANPMFVLGPKTGTYCQVNWLNACGSPADCCPPPLSIQKVRYIKIHIRHQSSLYWAGWSASTNLIGFEICVGKEGSRWCMYTPARGIRDMLDDEID